MPILQKRKRFPFFVLPMPKFLTRELKQIDDFVVLVRVAPNITWFNYIDSSAYLILFSLYSFIILLTWLIYALSKVPAALFTFLQHDGWMLFATIYTGYAVPSRLQIYVVVFWFTIAFLISTLWIVAQNRRFLREFRALRKMHTMTEAERKDFSLKRFLRVSLPLWMSSSLSYEPTAEELLKLLREREQATESQTQAIASTLEDGAQENEQEEQPSLSMLLTLTSSLTLSLIAPGDRHITIVLTDAVVSLVGFLATRARGVWTTKEELFTQVYDPGKESAFAMHRRRANTQVVKRAREAGFFPQQDKEDTASPTDSSQSPQHPPRNEEDEDTSANEEHLVPETEEQAAIDLFKNQIQGQTSSWQFTNDCSVDVFPFLTEFYRNVVAAQAFPLIDGSSESSLSLEQLRQGCHRIMEEYGDGFLASHMNKGYVWPWALPLYRKYQDDCLFVLAYSNQREREYLNTCQTRNERSEAVEHIAQLYGWQASVAAGLEPKVDDISSEQDMERCLIYYQKIKKKSAARATFQRYCKLRSRSNLAYEPGEALRKRAEEILSLAWIAGQLHKTEKDAS